jgi:hypothetical protein
MRPTQPTSEAEHKVLWWFLVVFFTTATAYMSFVWWSKSHECQTQCAIKTLGDGTLRFNSGGRFNLGTHCECADADIIND